MEATGFTYNQFQSRLALNLMNKNSRVFFIPKNNFSNFITVDRTNISWEDIDDDEFTIEDYLNQLVE